MTRNRVLVPLLLLLSLQFVLPAGRDKRPVWVIHFPTDPAWFHGVGMAEETGSPEADQSRADEAAKSQIVQEISATIESAVKTFYSEVSNSGEEGSETTLSEGFTSITSSYARETLSGIQIVDRYHDENHDLYYSYARLSRADFQRQIQERAEQAIRFSQDAYRLSRTSLERGEVYPAVSTLANALGNLLVSQAFVRQKLEGDIEGNGRSEMLQLRLQTELMQVLGDIRFETLGGDDQHGNRNRGLSEPLYGRFMRGDGTPLAGLPLATTVEGATATLQPGVVTNAEGEFNFYVENIDAARVARPVVHVRIDVPELAPFQEEIPYAFEVLDRVGPEYHFQMDVAASVRIFVRVLEEINGETLQRSSTDGSLIKALLAKRYTVLDARRLSREVSIEEVNFSILYEDYNTLDGILGDKADYAIIGLLSSNDSGSSSGVLFYARTDVRIVVLDLDSGQILASSHLDQVKGAGNSALRAAQKALSTASGQAVKDILDGLDEALR